MFSAGELSSLFKNTVSSAKLGWINCDRFTRMEGEKTMLALNHQADPNTKFYIIFKDIKSVLTLYSSGENVYTSTMYNGVPKDMDVKVVGIRITKGKVETFEHEGTAADINNLEIKFEPKKLEQIRSMLAKV